MSDWSIKSILARFKDLGPNWHEQLADEMAAAERARIVGATENHPTPLKPFAFIVTDCGEKTCSVEGSIVDDNLWRNAVVGGQKRGRKANLHVPGGPARSSAAEATHVYAEEYLEVRQVPAGSMVRLNST